MIQMDIQTKKLTLIQWLISLKDESVIEKVEALSKEDTDFWHELTEGQKAEIKQGIQELESGDKYDYEQVMLRHRS